MRYLAVPTAVGLWLVEATIMTAGHLRAVFGTDLMDPGAAAHRAGYFTTSHDLLAAGVSGLVFGLVLAVLRRPRRRHWARPALLGTLLGAALSEGCWLLTPAAGLLVALLVVASVLAGVVYAAANGAASLLDGRYGGPDGWRNI